MRAEMILLLLLLLPTLLNCSDLPGIDWKTCNTETICYAIDSCKKTGSSSEAIVLFDDLNIFEETCKVGIQSRFFSKMAALFQFQVLGDESPPSKLSLYKSSEELVSCELNGDKIELRGDDKIIKKYNIKLFEDRSRIEPGTALCAFTMERVPEFFTEEFKRESVIIHFNGKDYTKTEGKLIFEATDFVNCDTYSWKDQQITINKYKIKPVKNIDKETMDCKSHGPLYSLRFEKKTDDSVQEGKIQSITCTAGSFSYVEKEGDPPVVVDVPEDYSFYCAAEFDQICAKPNCAGPDCPQYTKGRDKEPARLECADNKWVIEDEYLVLDKQPICQQDTIDHMDESAFFVNFKDEQDMKLDVEKARCFVDYDCKKKSKLDYPACENNEGKDKCSIDYSNGKMMCTDSRTLIVRTPNDTMLTEKEYTCNIATGYWEDKNKNAIPDNSQVICRKEVEAAERIVDLSPAMMYMIVGGAFVGCITIAFIISLGIYCYFNPAAVFKVKSKAMWNRMSEAGKAAYCRTKFAQITQASSNNDRIVYGLQLIQLILDTETIESKCWDEAMMFLMQVQGTLLRSEENLSRLFARYLYVHAKKIIDKYGWLSRKSITNKTKKKKGLIRCVAVRLLSLCVNHDDDAKMLVISGFKECGFDAVDQYPHCGMLWSVLSYARCGTLKNESTGEECFLDMDQVVKLLAKIAFKAEIPMSENHVIVDYGSPAAQAAFALGGLAYYKYLQNNSKPILTKSEFLSGALSYFKGMSAGLYHNPAAMMISSCKVYDDADETILQGMKTIAPENEWNTLFENTLKIMLYYGRDFDFKKLLTRFAPDSPLANLYGDAHRNAQYFDEYAETQTEEVRKWLSSRTDKDELKKKPVFIKEDPVVTAYLNKPKEVLPTDGASEKNAADDAPAAETDAAAEAPPDAAAPVPAAAPAPAAPAPAAPDAAAPAPAAPVPAAAPVEVAGPSTPLSPNAAGAPSPPQKK